MRILLVEDHQSLAETIATLLAQQHWACDICSDGLEAEDYVATGIYDCLILDVMLPGQDGLTLLRHLRQRGITLPILLLTAKSSLDDRIEGLDSGADYYLTKPFHNEELLAVLRAIARRPEERRENQLSFNSLVLDEDRALLSYQNEAVQLSHKELQLFQMLFYRAGQVVPKEDILLKVWGLDSEVEENNVEAYISFLRKKLRHLKAPVEIRTLRRLGYSLQAEAEEDPAC